MGRCILSQNESVVCLVDDDCDDEKGNRFSRETAYGSCDGSLSLSVDACEISHVICALFMIYVNTEFIIVSHAVTKLKKRI
jgi:hypothetical protein